MKQLTALLLASLLVVGVSASHHRQPSPRAAPPPPAPPPGISLAASAWNIQYSTGVTLQAIPGMLGFQFLFPGARGSAHYLTTPYTAPLNGSLLLSIQITSDIEPVFGYFFGPDNPCVNPAHVRLYFEHYMKPPLTIADGQDDWRWWSNPAAIQLAPGTATLSVPLSPELWSDVYGMFGDDDPQGFSDTVAHPGAVGMTFGGGCFFGHGVNVTNGAHAYFSVVGFAVQ